MATQTGPCWMCPTAGSEQQAAELTRSVRGNSLVGKEEGVSAESQAGSCWQFGAFYGKQGTNSSLMQRFDPSMLPFKMTFEPANTSRHRNF